MPRQEKRRLDPAPDPDATDSDGPDPAGVEAVEPVEFPNLPSLVLSHWAWGRLHATGAHKFMLAAHQDGLKNDEVLSIAQMGAWGTQPSNIDRELTKKYLGNNTIPAPEVVRVPCLKPRTCEVEQGDCGIICPHDAFSALFHHHRDGFDEKFGVPDLGKFWDGASRLH